MNGTEDQSSNFSSNASPGYIADIFGEFSDLSAEGNSNPGGMARTPNAELSPAHRD